MAFGAAIATWFVVQAVLDAASPLGPKLEAITGFLAIVVLLIVLNWFVHKVYWSDWIGRHHRRRQRLLTQTGPWVVIGLVALGFTTVYREGFEVVLFLQNLQLQSGTSTVLEGVAIGLACTAVVGVLTFWLHHKLPYRRMLILTGALVAVVLMVMIGGTALSFMDLGWIPRTPTPFSVPTWMGTWFEIYPYWETIGAQLLAGTLVVGSYVLAEHVKVRRRVAKGEQPAVRAEAPPPTPDADRVLLAAPGPITLRAWVARRGRCCSWSRSASCWSQRARRSPRRSTTARACRAAPTPPSVRARSSLPRTPPPTHPLPAMSRHGIRTSPRLRSTPTRRPTSPTSAPTAATSSTRTSARRASTAFPMPWSASGRSGPR